ncbi:MAG: Crp/Fnr family transcriptional regulator [Flavobacteriia bacterium]|nr:Crp/Fnr family transcriptional regulator [Flavobacteriia bacterium]OJX36736.1 MAG: hypothetical protein BGO87_13160 [Flavobacteriia bacterium 40-80]
MTDPEIVKETFKGYLPISNELAAELAKISVIRYFGRNEKIYTGGSVAASVGIVRTGLVRSFILSGDKEMTIWFGEDGDFITSFHSFFTGEEGFETIECIEDTSVLMIPVEDIKELISQNKEMLFLYSIILEKSYMYWEQRYVINQIYESEQRYAHFYNRSKSMVLKIPLKILSSYLNIRQETLSRIRKRWLK